MYLVDYKIFNEFVTKSELGKNEIPIIRNLPAIIEYKRNGVIMAKIEVLSLNELKFLKNNNLIKRTINKYWIRGNEWKTIDNQQVKELCY
jgi:hypothetical protein